MPLVSSKLLLEQAVQDHFAVGAFNANNMEQVQAIVEAAQEERSPVILQVGQSTLRYAGLLYPAGLVKLAASAVDVPVVLHLDHGSSYEQTVQCLCHGFTSLMFDGSRMTFQENVALTRKICEVAHTCGVPVEAELGLVPGAGEELTQDQVVALMTDPDEAGEFVRLTQVDSLAVAVGSVHAMASQKASLDIERISAIRAATAVPLVLHGGSGICDESIEEAVRCGVAKINVATCLNDAFMAGLREVLADHADSNDPRNALVSGRKNVKECVREKIRMFGSAGRVSVNGRFVDTPRLFPTAHLG